MTPETGHGAVWYSWPPSERGSFLIYGTGNIKEIGLFRKLEDGSLENIKEETIELNSQGTLLGYPAEEGGELLYPAAFRADSVLVSLPASLNPGRNPLRQRPVRNSSLVFCAGGRGYLPLPQPMKKEVGDLYGEHGFPG